MLKEIRKKFIEFCKLSGLKFEYHSDRRHPYVEFIFTNASDRKRYRLYTDEEHHYTSSQIANIIIKDIKKTMLRKKEN